jgi:hypothetical protein
MSMLIANNFIQKIASLSFVGLALVTILGCSKLTDEKTKVSLSFLSTTNSYGMYVAGESNNGSAFNIFINSSSTQVTKEEVEPGLWTFYAIRVTNSGQLECANNDPTDVSGVETQVTLVMTPSACGS